MSTFGEWHFTADVERTRAAYALAPAGSASLCTCNGCRNFAATHLEAFPESFVDFLTTLGVDAAKDGEVYHVGRKAPALHYYGGWFHFVGTLDLTGDFAAVEMAPGFSVSLCKAGAPPLESLRSFRLVQIEFQSDHVPWVLDEPEAT